MRIGTLIGVIGVIGIIGRIGAALPIRAAEDVPPAYRYQTEVLAEGMQQPMEIELAPDNRIFFNEIDGKLKIYDPADESVVVAGEVDVFTGQENGFLGFALDPNFEKNHWIYLYYSPEEYVGQRLSRFVVEGDRLVAESESVMLEFGEQRRQCCHHAGSVEFGPDGNLFISTGDNTHPGGDSAGYAPIDERPDRGPWDAQKSSANTDDLRGKILRIRPTADGGYTIPEGNLFPPDGTQGRPEIYVMGCRNPWRMSVDQRTGIVYWGEVGPDAGGNGPRGPRGYDELNQARSAGNFGWPYFVGDNYAYADYDFESGEVGPKFDPKRPINDSPSNTGARELPPAQPALIYWPYAESETFPMLGNGGRTACAGPVFHFKPSYRETGGFPKHFDGCLLFYDWQRPFMKWARLDESSSLIGIEPFTDAIAIAYDRDAVKEARAEGRFVIRRPVDSVFGPDGCLYLLDYGSTWGANDDCRLVKISYQRGNLAPIAAAGTDQSSGAAPLTVKLTSQGSKDHEGDPLRFEWRLHPGNRLISRKANPTLTVKEPGNYVVELTVRDDQAAEATTSLPLVVGNNAPNVRFTRPEAGDFFTRGEPLPYNVSIQDAEDGTSDANPERFEPRTFVRIDWQKEDGDAASKEPGLALMQQSDCFNCHSVTQKIVGPPLMAIADKYRDQAGALENSVERVKNGSSGVWGEVPMLPHQSLERQAIRKMVDWIYELKEGDSGSKLARGLSGEIMPPNDNSIQYGILEAAYTDLGRAPAGSLSGKASLRLRARRLEAELADEKRGLQVLGHYIGSIAHGDSIRFTEVNLSTSQSVTFRVASAGSGGRIELRSGSPDGPLLAEAEVEVTGGWEKWVTHTAPLRKTPKETDLYVVFLNPGKGGLMNLDWLRFNPD